MEPDKPRDGSAMPEVQPANSSLHWYNGLLRQPAAHSVQTHTAAQSKQNNHVGVRVVL